MDKIDQYKTTTFSMISVHNHLDVYIYYRDNYVQAVKLALADASENLARRVENRPGQVEFCIGYIRDSPVWVSAKKF